MNLSIAYFDQQSNVFACAIYANSVLMPSTCSIQLSAIKYRSGEEFTFNAEYDPSSLPVGQTFHFTNFPAPSFGGVVLGTVSIVNTLQVAGECSLLD